MKKTYISWKQIFINLTMIKKDIINKGYKYVYGIPTAGAWLSCLLSQLNIDYRINYKIKNINNNPLKNKHKNNPQKTIIIDDLIDSGKTLKEFRERGYNCYTLFSKPHSPIYAPNLTQVTVIDKLRENNWLVFPWEKQEDNSQDGPIDAITRMIEFIGDDPTRQGLLETPKRVIKSYKELFNGYNKSPKSMLKEFDTQIPEDEIILMKNIEFYSTCEHHMLPFYGKAHVAYIPGYKDKVVGASKLARLFDIYARRLQIQERIGMQVTKALMKHLNAIGAACIIEAKHMCMCARGINKQESKMVTSTLLGAFREKVAVRNELMFLINNK